MKFFKICKGRSRRFAKDQSGTMTMEAALWFPLIMATVIVFADIAVIFMNKARITRIVQDGNRSFAVGIIRTCPDLVTWLETQTRVLAPSATASCDTSSVLGISIARVNVSTNELDLSGATSLVGNVTFGIEVNHVLEDI